MSYEERWACAQAAQTGITDRQQAQATGWSVAAVRKWRRAYQQRGAAGLAPVMGRPARGALSAFPARVRQELSRLRAAHPGWGPLTLLEELRQQPALAGEALPSRARIAAYLQAQGLARRYQRHNEMPAPSPPRACQPHDEWEMDAQGRQPVAELGLVSIVNLADVVSHLKTGSYAHLWQRGLSGADYQLDLRCSFLHFGLPLRISLDHESAFYDNTSLSPFPTRLILWLVALGVAVVFIQKAPPLAHAQIERGHQTISAQAVTGQDWADLGALGHGLDQRCRFLNTRYPSRSLGGHAPLEVFPEAGHSGRAYRPEWEEQLLDLHRMDTFLAQGRWFRETNLHGEFWLGMQRYNVGRAGAYTTQELTFDPLPREFIAKTVGTDHIQRFVAKGLSKMDLMGELFPLTHFPTYQLALPLTREDGRRTTLAGMLTGTTF